MSYDHPRPTPGDPLEGPLGEFRARLGDAPPATADIAVAAFRAQHDPRRVTGLARVPVARIVLALAAITGVALDVPVLLGTAVHTSADVAVLHVAIAIGFAVAAWSPARYARGMAPVAVAAAVLLFLPQTTATVPTPQGVLSELSHLPVLVGAASLLLGRWRSGGVRRRHA